MAFVYEKMMSSTIEDSINEFCGPYCNPERNQLGFCPTACIPFCYPICHRPFLNVIPPISPDVVIKTINHQSPGVETGNGYPNMFPLFFLAMMLIGVSIFLCYAISKFAKSCSGSRSEAEEEEENASPVSFIHQEFEPEVDNQNGLRQSVINSITVLKFKKDGGFIEGAKCSVCLNVFQDDETLRLLPNCEHAFHVHCIDTWLKSHKNCPMCRADIVFLPSSSPEKQSSGGGDRGELKKQDGAETETGEVEFSERK